MDAHRLYKPDASYDCVIADHVLFYCDNLDAECSEILRVLKPGGVFVCSTYSSRQMCIRDRYRAHAGRRTYPRLCCGG